MKNNYLVVIVAIIVGLGGFYGGMKYQESKTPEFAKNLPENFEQMRGGQMGHISNNDSTTTVRGEIISMDDSSVTVKLSDDSSKIVIFSDSTSINVSEEGSAENLIEGTEVMVIGQTNSDGSVTASNIQIGTRMFRETTK